MTDYAVHIRIFDPEPTDDLVNKRATAIKEVAGRLTKGLPVIETFRTANDLATALADKGKLSTDLADVIEGAIKKQSTAFVRAGQEIQMQVCAALSAIAALEKSNPSAGDLLTADVLASALWSAISFQPPRKEPKVEALRSELLAIAHGFVMKTGASARHRKPIPEFKVELKEGLDSTAVAAAIKAGAAATISALRHNSAVDREELDLLWWVQADWSDLLQRRYTGAPPLAAAVSAGLEAGRLLRRMPSDAHLRLVLRHVVDGEPLSLPDLLAQLGDDRDKLAAAFAGSDAMKACPAVFPLLSALAGAAPLGSGSKIARSPRDWAARALLESAILEVTAHLPSVGV